MTEIQLLGHEIELAPLRGRKGARFLQALQVALDDITSAIHGVDSLASMLASDELSMSTLALSAKAMRKMGDVVLDDAFMAETLPIFWMCSAERLTKKKALEIIDESIIPSDTPQAVLVAILQAIDFWGPDKEEAEELDEAIKKSPGDDAEE